jgi:hypothetical protein
MRVTVHRSGGLAGLRVGGTIETADLDDELAARAEAALEPQRLEAAAAEPEEPGAADQHVYDVTPESGATYSVGGGGQSDVPAVLDELVNEIIRRRRG